VPIVLDGFISLAAALVACWIEPKVKAYLIPSHSGKEPAVKAIEKELGLQPVIYAKMALGEGTGAVMMLQLLKTANAVYENSVSFEGAGIGQYERFQ
jgi:nicotinate-nucleotide--dimethylbenzimidazole phosphoribosyltransferase